VTLCPVVPVTGLAELRSELGTIREEHDFAAQVRELKVLAVEHVTAPEAVAPMEYPALQITVTLCPVTPVIEPASCLSELATCEAVQGLAAQVTVLKVPAVEHVAGPPEAYPWLQMTVIVCPVVPVIEPLLAMFELAT